MAKKKFNITQKEHTVALSQDNVATRRQAPKPQGRLPEEAMPVVSRGPAIEEPPAPEFAPFHPQAAPAVPNIIAIPVAKAEPAKSPTLAKTARPRRTKPVEPVEPSGARTRKTATVAVEAAPVSAPDPLLKRMPLASPSRSRMISLRARNAQLRQQLEELEQSNKARSRV